MLFAIYVHMSLAFLEAPVYTNRSTSELMTLLISSRGPVLVVQGICCLFHALDMIVKVVKNVVRSFYFGLELVSLRDHFFFLGIDEWTHAGHGCD